MLWKLPLVLNTQWWFDVSKIEILKYTPRIIDNVTHTPHFYEQTKIMRANRFCPITTTMYAVIVKKIEYSVKIKGCSSFPQRVVIDWEHFPTITDTFSSLSLPTSIENDKWLQCLEEKWPTKTAKFHKLRTTRKLSSSFLPKQNWSVPRINEVNISSENWRSIT